MKRTYLIALAERVESQAEDWKDDTDARALARFARQIAEAQPVAWAATDESGTVVEALGMNQSRRFDTALYILPLED